MGEYYDYHGIKISYNKRERARFEKSIGMTIEEASELYDCCIVIQGCSYTDGRTFESKEHRFIDCCSESIDHYGFGGQSCEVIDKYKVEHLFPYDLAGVYCMSNMANNNSIATWHDQYGKIIARLDSRGNLHMTNFYHIESSTSGRREALPFLIFHNIVKQAWDDTDGRDLKKKIRECLFSLNPERITKVETAFDKEKYIEEAQEKVKEITDVSIQTATSEARVLSLMLDAERKHRNTLINRASVTGFSQGISFLNDSMGWKFKNNRLYYKKTIYVKYCNYYDKTWEVSAADKKTYYIKNLSILITPFPVQADCTSNNHPNVSTFDSVCIGDLQHAPLMQVLRDLPKVLETAGLVSPWRKDIMREMLSHVVNERTGKFTLDVEENYVFKLNPDNRIPSARALLDIIDFNGEHSGRPYGFADDVEFPYEIDGDSDEDEISEDLRMQIELDREMAEEAVALQEEDPLPSMRMRPTGRRLRATTHTTT